ncbi:hypothetical protein BU17DRAFT_96580 [Hysterangium stoloniferum]|nr:hypothetical protein BU17DRAFT_96580 [Hysterangium stoloniferum]
MERVGENPQPLWGEFMSPVVHNGDRDTHFLQPQPQVPCPLSLGALKPNLVVRPPIVIPHIPPAHWKPHAEHYHIYHPRPNNNCKKRRTDASPYDTSISPHDFPANEYSNISPVDGAPKGRAHVPNEGTNQYER